MKSLFAILLMLAAPMACGAENLITVHYEQGMRIPNHRVAVAIAASRQLTLWTESKGGDRKETIIRISPAAFEELWKALEKTDWKKARQDRVRGLDGTSVRIIYDGREVSLWSPDYETEKRGLETTQNIVRKVFGLAGLDPTGMPAKSVGGKAAQPAR